MKKLALLCATLLVVLSASGIVSGCNQTVGKPELLRYEDGNYRGSFIDEDVIQINIEFVLENGIVQSARFRHLRRNDDYYLETEEEPYRSVIDQYRETLDYLIGKDLRRHLTDLYHPEHLVITQVDGYSGATIRSGKIISSIRDGLNRGVYSY